MAKKPASRRPLKRAPKRRLVGALLGGPLGILTPAAAGLVWLASDGDRWADVIGDARGGTGAIVTGLLMLAVGVGIPVGLLGAVLARRFRAGRGAAWGDGATAFVGAYLAGTLAVVPLACLGGMG